MSTDREREALIERLAYAYDRASLRHSGWCDADIDAAMEVAEAPHPRSLAIARDLILAGWMPRPEPGSAEWEAMVERGARAIWEQPGSGCSWDRLAQHVRGQCINDATACLRAALAAPDTGGADGE